ncbi:MAG: hypothetical protein DRR19_01720 [Candidatus Parabeggiatoa sp. nov. 1]|nr:MAG: hypothetical protein DRR19_01720 [Gammaproteobacteria bacterium]
MKDLNIDEKKAEKTLLDNDFPDIDDRNAENIQLDIDIACYVEGMEDVHFWKDVFDSFAPELKIIFYPYSRENRLKSGKKTILTEHNIKNAGASLILCVDSDLEYLLKNEPLFSHPYIFHTHTYSIENYKIFPEALARIVEKSSEPNADKPLFSFVNFIKYYSKAAYPLLRYILYFEKIKLEQMASKQHDIVSEPLLSENELKSVFCIKPTEISLADNANDVIEGLKDRISHLIEKIKKKHTDIDLSQIDSALSELNIKEEQTYWYLNGHIMYDCVAKIMMGKVIGDYRKEKREWFKLQEQTEILKTKQREYNNRIKNIDWKTLMSDGYMYCFISLNRCPPIQKIKQDVETILSP